MRRHVEIVRHGKTIRGMLHIPDGASGKVPGVVMYHGFTGNKAESHWIFVKLSKALEDAGIASIRMDFYGTAESDGEFFEMTPQTELDDAKEILNYMKNLSEVDGKRVGVMGLSMGGYIAGITAGDNREDVKSACLWAPAGNIKDIFKNCMNTCEEVGEGLYDIGDLILGAAAYENAAAIDHLKRTAAYDKEICVIHGTGDQTVPYDIGLQYRNVLKKPEFHSIEGADHTFSSSKWQKEVLTITVDFFKKTL